MLIRFVPTLLAYINKNKSDKFYCRKSMQAADEKLIISELGPYQVEGVILVYNLPIINLVYTFTLLISDPHDLEFVIQAYLICNLIFVHRISPFLSF